MKRSIRHIFLVAVILLFLGGAVSGVVLYLDGKPKKAVEVRQTIDPKAQEPVVIQDDVPRSLEECYGQSEKKYRDYVVAHGQAKNQNGNTTYSLPQPEWDKINKDRGDEYHACDLKFS